MMSNNLILREILWALKTTLTLENTNEITSIQNNLWVVIKGVSEIKTSGEFDSLVFEHLKARLNPIKSRSDSGFETLISNVLSSKIETKHLF